MSVVILLQKSDKNNLEPSTEFLGPFLPNWEDVCFYPDRSAHFVTSLAYISGGPGSPPTKKEGMCE